MEWEVPSGCGHRCDSPTSITGAVSIYGAQSIDFAASRSSYQIHLAENDPWLPEDDAIFMEATMRLEALKVEVYTYPGTTHGFFEEGLHHDQAAVGLGLGSDAGVSSAGRSAGRHHLIARRDDSQRPVKMSPT